MLDCLGNIGTEKNTIRILDVFLTEHLHVFECTYIFIYIYTQYILIHFQLAVEQFPECFQGAIFFVTLDSPGSSRRMN